MIRNLLYPFHPVFKLCTKLGTIVQLLLDFIYYWELFFISYLVFETCPEVHRYRSELNFHSHHLFLIVQVNGSLNYKMQTPVSIRLRIFDM